MTMFGFKGSASLWLVFEFVDASYVRKLLPDYLELAPSRDFPDGQHPMMYSFGTQKVAMRPFGWPKIPYHESIIGVCSVKLKNSTKGPYSLMTTTPVSGLIAWLIGRVFGFPKTMKHIAQGRIAAEKESYSIATLFMKAALVSNEFEPAGPEADPSDLPAFKSVEPFLDHPVISRALWGSLLASRFQITKGSQRVTPVKAKGVVTAQDVAGLPGGTYHWPSAPRSPLGVFLTKHDWIADWPSRVSP